MFWLWIKKRKCKQLLLCCVVFMVYLIATIKFQTTLYNVALSHFSASGDPLQRMITTTEKYVLPYLKTNTSLTLTEVGIVFLNVSGIETKRLKYKVDNSVVSDTKSSISRLCEKRGFGTVTQFDYPKSTIIVSIVNISGRNAIGYVGRILRHTPETLTDDVIVTIDDSSMTEDDKDLIEQAFDICPICRTFFLKESNIYKHRNFAAPFARSSILVFIDARVEPEENWLEAMVFELTFNKNVVVSPHLRLRHWSPYRRGREVSSGLSRLGVTWDLEVIRIPVTAQQNELLLTEKEFSVNQTAILKEVFAVQKDFFQQLGLFETFSHGAGAEHVDFSLKVINCDGEILTVFCSSVFLDIPLQSAREYDIRRDFFSPSFLADKQQLSNYKRLIANVWLDAYSLKIFQSSSNVMSPIQFRFEPENKDVRSDVKNRHGRYDNDFIDNPGGTANTGNSRETENQQYDSDLVARRLLGRLKAMECETTNFRYVMAKYQPDMLTVDKKVQKYGYIRSLDGTSAIGIDIQDSRHPSHLLHPDHLPLDALRSLPTSVLRRDPRSGWPILVMTTNSSQWVGPFSYSKGKLHLYNRAWCVSALSTRASGNGATSDVDDIGANYDSNEDDDVRNNNGDNILLLAPCQSSGTGQSFLFSDDTLRWSGEGAKLCVEVDSGPNIRTERGNSRKFVTSHDLVLNPCANFRSQLLCAGNNKCRYGSGGSHRPDRFKIDMELVDGKL